MNLFKDKRGRIQKIILIFLIAIIILLIPVGIYASENATSTKDNSSSKQPLKEIVSDVVEQDLIEKQTSNEKEIPEPEINETLKESLEKTSKNESIINEDNSTNNNGLVKEDKKVEDSANIDIEIQYPEKITRGDTITLTATITNTGNLEINSILVNWFLPSGFELISKSQEEFEKLSPNNSFESKIKVSTSNSTLSGINEIKIGVYY